MTTELELSNRAKRQGFLDYNTALQIQACRMAIWKSALQPEVYAKLEQLVTARNREGYSDPYDTWRGEHLTKLVEGIVLGFNAAAAYKLP